MDSSKQLWWQLVRFGFRLLYNELAWTYDLVAWVVSLGQWHTWQRTALDHLDVEPGACVLDLAHGTGNLQLDLYAAGYQRIGIDLSRFMGRLARRKLRQHRLPAPLVRGYGQHLPFPDDAFDSVVSTFPAPFIIEEATLRELRRVLKPGRRLVIVTGAVFGGGNLVENLLETAYRVTGQRGPWPTDLDQRFAQAGFEVEIRAQTQGRSTVFILVATATNRQDNGQASGNHG